MKEKKQWQKPALIVLVRRKPPLLALDPLAFGTLVVRVASLTVEPWDIREVG